MLYSIPWYVALLQSIPEAFLVIILGFTLVNIEVAFQKAFLIALLGALFIYFVRLLPLEFGMHTILAILFWSIAAILLFKTNFIHCLIAILIGEIVLAILQCAFLPLCFYITSTEITDLTTKPVLNIYFFIPQAIMMLLIYTLIKKSNFYILDLKKMKQFE